MCFERFKALIFSAFLLFLYGCHSSRDQEDYNVFHYNQINPITSLDPAFAKSQNNIWACNHLFDGLVQLDDSLNVIPSIAKSWSISDDGKIYTFDLRQDVYFHKNDCFAEQSRKVNAQDFVYSLGRLLSEEVNSPGSWIFSNIVEDAGSFQARDDSTLVITLNKAFLPLLGILTMEYCSVIPEECVEYYGDRFRSNPVGSGPFVFKRWIENQGLYLLRNDNYFDPNVNKDLDGVKTSFITDRNIAYLELLKGKVDFISGVASSVINELLDADGNLKADKADKIKLYKSPYLNTEYLGINMSLLEDGPLANKKLRQALNYAIDKKQMMASLRNNAGTPALSGFVPKGLPSYDPNKVKGYAYDLEQAELLLVESGYSKDAAPIEIHTNKDYLDITTYVAKQWERLGVNVEIKLMESAVLRDGMRNNRFQLFRASWIADYPDAENYLSMFYSKNPAPPNYTRFQNLKFDQLYEQSLQESNDSIRYDLYQQMDRIIVEEAPVIFLFYDVTSKFVGKNISNISNNALNLLKAKQVIKEKSQ